MLESETHKDIQKDAGDKTRVSDPGMASKGKKVSAGENSEDFIRPIRLAKRNEEKTESKEEFQCRPIRLGNRNKQPESVPTNESPKERKRSIQIRNLPIIEPSSKPNYSGEETDDMIFAICVVDFHHVRGPEIEWWKSNYHPEHDADLFKNLAFQALPDGSHLFEETFSNFNLVYDFSSGVSIDNMTDIEEFKYDPRNLKTLFGCSCVRQIRTDRLSSKEIERNQDITRSIVQKAVVVIVRKQPIFTKIKEKLSITTKSFFLQENFDNYEVFEDLFNNLNSNFKLVENDIYMKDQILKEQQLNLREEEFFVNLNLRTTLLSFKSDLLVIFKALLLEEKILIYSNSNLELLTQFQNNLISLIPNLINNLDNSGCSLIDYIETNSPLKRPDSLKTNNRNSMLRFFGLPLQIFNTKNSFWNPYLPLQQLDEMNSRNFMAGCSNPLFVNQAVNLKIDILINLDTNEVTFPTGKKEELSLSHEDKKVIGNLINSIGQFNDDYVGNDDYIRYRFEDYLLSLLSSMRYNQYTEKFNQPPPGFQDTNDIGNLATFNASFVESWKNTSNYKIWNCMADEFIFNFINPEHLGSQLADPNSFKFTNIFNNLKSRTTAIALADEVKPHKFIPKDAPENEENKDELSPNISHPTPEKNTKRQTSWSWNFKKKRAD